MQNGMKTHAKWAVFDRHLGKLVAFCLSVSLRFPGDTLEPVLIAGAFLGAAVGRHLPTDVVGDSNSPCATRALEKVQNARYRS